MPASGLGKAERPQFIAPQMLLAGQEELVELRRCNPAPGQHGMGLAAMMDLVLEKMLEQGYITQQQYSEGREKALPPPSEISPPKLESKAPYFTAWLRQQLVERYGASKTFFGGLKVKSTLDLKLQEAAEEAHFRTG